MRDALKADFADFCLRTGETFRERTESARETRKAIHVLGFACIFFGFVLRVLSEEINWWALAVLAPPGIVLFAAGYWLEKRARDDNVDAAEMVLARLAAQSDLVFVRSGADFPIDAHNDFAGILGGPFAPSALAAQARWRHRGTRFRAAYARYEAEEKPFRYYLFAVERESRVVAPVIIVPEGVEIEALMAPPPGTNEPPLADALSVDLGDSGFARFFRCYSNDARGAVATVSAGLRGALVSLAAEMDWKRLRLVIAEDAIVAAVGPIDEQDFRTFDDDERMLDPAAALTALRDLSVPLHLIDGLAVGPTVARAAAP